MIDANLPDGWRLTDLSSIAQRDSYGLVDGPFGSNLPASSYVPNGIPVIRGTNLSLGEFRFRDEDFVFVSDETAQQLKRSLCGPLDIIFTKKGTLGQLGLIPRSPRYPKYLLSSNQMKLSVDETIADPRFVYYYISSPANREKVIRDSEATGVPKTNLAYLRTFPIVLPPLSEQHAIARVLSTLDDKIELNSQINETLESMVRAIFKSWFVDFDPIRAKMEGREPYGMDTETASLFPSSFEDSALGKIPKGWSIKNLPEIIEINPQRYLCRGQSAPYLEMSNMPTSSARALDWEYREFSSGMKFVNRDVLLARITPCLENGKTAFVDFLEEGQVGWGSTEYIVFHSKPPLPPEYAYFLARSDELRTHAIQNMTGTSGRQRVPAECFKAYPIIVPPEKIAVQFGEIVRPFMLTMKQYDEVSRTLAAIRDTLLPKLLSGEIRVKDAEKHAEAYSLIDLL